MARIRDTQLAQRLNTADVDSLYFASQPVRMPWFLCWEKHCMSTLETSPRSLDAPYFYEEMNGTSFPPFV